MSNQQAHPDADHLFKKRHSLAHLMAMAVLEYDPTVKMAIGPVIDTGFYYDFEFSEGKIPSPEDLKQFEKKVKKLISGNIDFVLKEISADDARKEFAAQPYKLELIEELAKNGEGLTTYTSGNFTDLCAGPHVQNTKEIDADSFKISHTAGAYWKGDEKNKMLTRVYGLAFNNKEELDAYIHQQDEAKKRDHKKLGKELGLFIFSELVGPGLPLWTPKGTIIREVLNDYVWELRQQYGYQKVTIPHITKKDLYMTSGHWDKYADDLFKITTREDHMYAMKPMNCPHHTQIYDCEPRSYRDLPQRYCETTMVYRDEQSGELAGLSRVLSITQDDAHVFCRMNQVGGEIEAVWNIIQKFYTTFGFKLTPRLSRRDPGTPANYLGKPENWDFAESSLKDVITSHTSEWVDGPGESAFYGPKIDFLAFDAIGRKHQVATIQLDFVQPERFNLTCTNEKGEKELIAMLHVAIMGSIERFMGVMIEHFAGAFPTWMAPTQIEVVPVADAHHDYAQKIVDACKAKGIRVHADYSSESLGKKIRAAKVDKTPYIFVVGDKEVEAGTVSIEARDMGDSKIEANKIAPINFDEAISKIADEIKTRALVSVFKK